jgi:hypothetical protein
VAHDRTQARRQERACYKKCSLVVAKSKADQCTAKQCIQKESWARRNRVRQPIQKGFALGSLKLADSPSGPTYAGPISTIRVWYWFAYHPGLNSSDEGFGVVKCVFGTAGAL